MWSWVLFSGCGEEPPGPCGDFDQVFVWEDADGDGFGNPTAIGWVCEAGPNQATNDGDCDDARADVFPRAVEVCDLADQDCDGWVDDGLELVPWYPDEDGDGYGDDEGFRPACQAPGADWSRLGGDCDDVRADIGPEIPEVCNDGLDDDCDGLADDLDPGIDPASQTNFYRDQDRDGYGDPLQVRTRCEYTQGGDPVLNADDCDDLDPVRNPLATEVCNEVDDDCDGLTDDQDDVVDPETQRPFFADVDGDGYGDPNAIALACTSTPGVGVDNALDCDDTDELANRPQAWYADADGDGSGSGPPVDFSCLRPGPDLAPASNGVDCAPNDPTVSPAEPDPCGDGRDTDCDGYDDCATCAQILASDPTAPSGTYELVDSKDSYLVWCDMDTDGGGWTLVGSTFSSPMDDVAIAWHSDLQDLTPVGAHFGVWDGMRPWLDSGNDVRFACKALVNDVDFEVDLVFYDNDWYDLVTSSPFDDQTCFLEGGYSGIVPPQRRDLVANRVLPAGDPYNSGSIEGEDVCADYGDFTIDFDDRGMDSNQNDGTDWGEDDGSYKCGSTFLGQAWFVFFRE